MPALFEDFRCHVPGCPARSGKHMERFFVHDPRQPKVSNQQVGIIFRCPKQEIFRLEIAMHNAMVVQVCYGRQGGADQLGRIRLKVAALATYAIEQFAAQRKVGNEVDCSPARELVPVLRKLQHLRLFIVSK